MEKSPTKKSKKLSNSLDSEDKNYDTAEMPLKQNKTKKKKKKETCDDRILEVDHTSENDADHITPSDEVPHKKKKNKKETKDFEVLGVAGTNENIEDSNLLDEVSLKQKKKKKKNKEKDCEIPDTNGSANISKNEILESESSESVEASKKQKKHKKREKENENVALSESKEKKRRKTDNNEDDHAGKSFFFNPKNSYNEDNSQKYQKNFGANDWGQNFTEEVHMKAEGRQYTTSIAVPASILEETCLLHELRTYVIGQLARCACIYSVDEIIVYNDMCWRNSRDSNKHVEEYMGMMKMILEFQECPQYLRRQLFPQHRYLGKAGILNAVNAPHHLLASQWCKYREGAVTSKHIGKVSLVDVGLKSYVEVDRRLEEGFRVTVKFPPEAQDVRKAYGSIVSPDEPRTAGGMYWGYTVRTANSLSEVLKSDRFEEGYDLIIGTSDKGTDAQQVTLKKFNHALIVFGGVNGLEAAIESDEALCSQAPSDVFEHYLNVCPNQASRTIRSEEAVLITMAVLSPKLIGKGVKKAKLKGK